MTIHSLSLHDFRNFETFNFMPSQQITVLCGENGTGKTSVLEAIYYLGHGRSFRTHLCSRITRYSADSFSIAAKVGRADSPTPLGLSRSSAGTKIIKYNGSTIDTMSTLAKTLPIQLMSTVSYRIFHDGPKLRRRYLDWGLFHVKHTFYSAWQQLQKALKQRNAGLKRQISAQEIDMWNQEIAYSSEIIGELREQYLAELTPIVHKLLGSLLPEKGMMEITHSRGWPEGQALYDMLTKSHSYDLKTGRTAYGAHRADVIIKHAGVPVQDSLSQGQQKLLAYALHLAQGLQYKLVKDTSPIYLIDDLPSELDQQKIKSIVAVLQDLNSQIFITSISEKELDSVISHNDTLFIEVDRDTTDNRVK